MKWDSIDVNMTTFYEREFEILTLTVSTLSCNVNVVLVTFFSRFWI